MGYSNSPLGLETSNLLVGLIVSCSTYIYQTLHVSRTCEKIVIKYNSPFKKQFLCFPDFLGCIQHLVDKGARVNARDLAGHTPLFHCTGMMATGLTLKIAAILIKNGAEVNATNRMGCTPLFEPTMASRFDSVDFLLVSSGYPDKFREC